MESKLKEQDSNGSGNQEDADEKMTLAEREKWLRERGVQIEDPNTRTATANDGGPSILDQMAGLSLENDQDGSIKFVYIPADESKPLRTLSLPKSFVAATQTVGDALPEYVKKYFADSKSIDATLLKQQATKHFAGGQLKDLAETNISTAAMNSVAAQGAVESFPLVHPADTNQFTGVYVYLDEVGLLKKLPHNQRASQIAAACGYNPAPNFYGDVFVGRVRTKPVFHNVDFQAGVDTDRATATWMQRAIAENLAWQQEMNRVTGKEGVTQPAQVGTDGNVASEDSFDWSQDEDEIELSVPFGEAVDKKKVKATFLPRTIKVAYDGKEKLKVKLYAAIDVDGCTWTIDGENLVITCEKSNPGELWPRVKEG